MLLYKETVIMAMDKNGTDKNRKDGKMANGAVYNYNDFGQLAETEIKKSKANAKVRYDSSMMATEEEILRSFAKENDLTNEEIEKICESTSKAPAFINFVKSLSKRLKI